MSSPPIQNPSDWCRGCSNTGIIWARPRNINEPTMPYMFRCFCARGDARAGRNAYPKWSVSLKKDWEVLVGDEKSTIAK